MYDLNGVPVPGAIYFNGCARAGGCASTGSDGIGFGNQEGYISNHASFRGWGGTWNSSAVTARLRWGSNTIIAGPLNYYYRPKGSAHSGMRECV